MPWHVSKGNLFFSDLPCPDTSVKAEKNKLPLLTCQGMEDLRKTNYLYWHVRAWTIWEKQMTFTDMSGHGRSEKNKLPLLICQGMEDPRKTNDLYWHVRAWKIWETQITFTDLPCPLHVSKGNLFFSDLPCPDMSVKIICFSQIFHALTYQ
jgi:hypothetical protein